MLTEKPDWVFGAELVAVGDRSGERGEGVGEGEGEEGEVGGLGEVEEVEGVGEGVGEVVSAPCPASTPLEGSVAARWTCTRLRRMSGLTGPGLH